MASESHLDHKHKYRTEAIYVYHSENGDPVYRKLKHRCACGDKTFAAQRRVGTSTYVSGTAGIPARLYNAHLLARLRSKVETGQRRTRAWLVEGEKDADALTELGEVAVSPPNGAQSWRDSFTDLFRGLDEIYIVADRDPAGRAFAGAIVLQLQSVVERVAVLEPREGKDVFEHLAAGYGLDDFWGLDRARPDLSITRGLATVFQDAGLRDGDPGLPGEGTPNVGPWMDVHPYLTVAREHLRPAYTAEVDRALDPYAVPIRCGLCHGYLIASKGSGAARPCYRCRITYRVRADETTS